MLEIQNLYLEHIQQDQLKNMLDTNANVTFYAFILHDKDVRDDGSLKKPHYHLYMEYQATSHKGLAQDVKNAFPMFQRVVKVNNKVSALRYLTHKDHPNKFQYETSAVVTNDMDLYLEVSDNSNVKGTKEIEEMLEQFMNELDEQGRSSVTAKEVARYFRAHKQVDYFIRYSNRLFQNLRFFGFEVIGQ